MDNNSRVSGIIPAVIIAAGILGATILVSPGINKVSSSLDKLATLAERYVKNQAIDGCYQAGRVTRIDEEENSIQIPEKSWTDICLKEKGYK